MADLPPPPPSSDLPDVAVVTIVHKVKSKLGYTEINTPFPGFENDKVNHSNQNYFHKLVI